MSTQIRGTFRIFFTHPVTADEAELLNDKIAEQFYAQDADVEEGETHKNVVGEFNWGGATPLSDTLEALDALDCVAGVMFVDQLSIDADLGFTFSEKLPVEICKEKAQEFLDQQIYYLEQKKKLVSELYLGR